MTAARILIVDDSLTIRRALEFILKPHGYTLEFAADGREALSRAVSFGPDLVLLDYVLPDMRGPDVCAALALTPTTESTPVILVSAKGASIRQAYQDAQNVVSYITKPFKAEIVTSVVANALARVRAAGATREDAAADPAPSAATRSLTGPTPATHVRAAAAPPATVEETFSTLLRQLEDAIADDAAAPRESARRTRQAVAAQDLAPGLARASQRMGEVAAHLIDGSIAPYRLRADGSFASIAATLLEAHRSLCETAIALAAAGAPAGRLPETPRVVAVGPPEHALLSELARALEVAPEVPAIVLGSDFAALPSLVKLLAPEFVVVVPGVDGALDEALARSAALRAEGMRLVALGDGAAPDGAAFDARLESADATREWIGELARGHRDAPATGVEIALEIVTV